MKNKTILLLTFLFIGVHSSYGQNTVTVPELCNEITGSIEYTIDATIFANISKPFTVKYAPTNTYDFHWEDIDQLSGSFNGLPLGTYDVYLPTDEECLEIFTVTIFSYNILIITSTVTQPSSDFGCMNGAVDVTISYGKAPWIVNWYKKIKVGGGFIYTSIQHNTNVFGMNDGEDITGLGPGDYQVEIIDEVCGVQKRNFTMECVCADDCTIIGAVQDPSCGDLGKISIEIDCGGQESYHLPFSYLWNDQVIEQNRTDLIPGTYCLTVTDQNNCTLDRCFDLSGGLPLIVEIADINNMSKCIESDNGDIEGNCNGSLNIEVISGTPPYTYNWSNGETTQDISNLCFDIYSVTVTDNSGCQQIISHSICCCGYIPKNGNSSTQSPLDCYTNGGSIVSLSEPELQGAPNGSISTTIGGGLSPRRCYWTYPDGTIVKNCSGYLGGIQEAGTYCLTIDDGCEDITQCWDVPDCNSTVISVTEQITNTCPNLNFGIIRLMNTNGGTGPYKYNWSNGANGETISSLVAGNYTVTITDIWKCQSVYTFSINEENEIVEIYDGECKFHSECSGMTIPNSQRMGDIETMVNTLCKITEICSDPSLPGGEDILRDNEQLDTYPVSRPILGESGCTIYDIWCTGEDGNVFGGDDFFLFASFPTPRVSQIFDNGDCISCYSAIVCEYTDINGVIDESLTSVIARSTDFVMLGMPLPGSQCMFDTIYDEFECVVDYGCQFIIGENQGVAEIWNFCIPQPCGENSEPPPLNSIIPYCDFPSDMEFIENEIITSPKLDPRLRKKSDMTTTNDLIVFPNPTYSQLNIELANESSIITKYELVSTSNKLVQSENISPLNQRSFTLDIFNIPTGIYILIVYDNYLNRIAKKVIKL